MKRLILGPPGTGKTTRLLREIGALVDRGFALKEIAFVSFTRRAIHESLTRGADVFSCGESDLEWFKTMHSAFTQRLQLKSFMDAAAGRRFREAYGYEISDEGTSRLVDDGPAPALAKTDDDKLREVNDFARVRLCTINDAIARMGSQVHVGRAEQFAVLYRRFMESEFRHDYTAILEQAVMRGSVLPVRALIVDEAQDLSPLQIRALLPTIDTVEEVIIAGDDDQAIFTFAGSEPDWLISLAKSSDWRTEVLSQSYRIPVRVHGLAQRIIGRNRRRVAKRYDPRPAEGVVVYGVDDILGELEMAEGTSAFLARTRRGTKRVAEALFAGDTPYVVQRGEGPNPMGRASAIKAVETMATLAAGEPVPRGDLIAALKEVRSRGDSLLPHGVKAKIERLPASLVSPAQVSELGLGALRDHVRNEGPARALTAMEGDYRAWYARIWDLHGRVPEPKVTVSTIHSTKGAEWGTVVLSPDHPWPVQQTLDSPDPESEHRVAYVGATRAKERLVIANQHSRYGYAYP